MSQFYDITCSILRAIYRARLLRAPVHDANAEFPSFTHFVDRWEGIRDEVQAYIEAAPNIPLVHELMPEQAPYSCNDGLAWRAVLLKVYGAENKRVLANFPIVRQALNKAPEVTSAAISIIEGNKVIPVHWGPFGAVLRFQLGLIVPVDEKGRPATVLTLDNVEHRVGAGEYLLWDDTFEHGVRNYSDKARVVLLLDVWKQSLPLDLRLISNTVLILTRLYLRRSGAIQTP
jgi:aspartate beta-hydroxylase